MISELNNRIISLFTLLLLFSCQVVSDSLQPHDRSMPCFLSFSVSWSLLKLMSIESAILSTHLIRCHPLLLLPSIFPSSRVFSNESAVCIRWPKHWSFSFSISPGVVIRIKGLNTYKAVSMFPDTGNRVSINFTEILSSSVTFKMD